MILACIHTMESRKDMIYVIYGRKPDASRGLSELALQRKWAAAVTPVAHAAGAGPEKAMQSCPGGISDAERCDFEGVSHFGLGFAEKYKLREVFLLVLEP